MNVWEEWTKRWPDFHPAEVLCPSHLDLLSSGTLVVPLRFLDKLQAFRFFAEVPLIVCGKTRDMADMLRVNHRKGVEPEHYSFHLWCGVDLKSAELSSVQLFDLAVQFGQFNGIGLYPKHIHVDDRDLLGAKGPIVWRGVDV